MVRISRIQFFCPLEKRPQQQQKAKRRDTITSASVVEGFDRDYVCRMILESVKKCLEKSNMDKSKVHHWETSDCGEQVAVMEQTLEDYLNMDQLSFGVESTDRWCGHQFFSNNFMNCSCGLSGGDVK